MAGRERESMTLEVSTSTLTYVLIALAVGLIIFNQYTISRISSSLGTTGSATKTLKLSDKSLGDVDLSELKSTGHSIAALFPVEDIKTTQDAVDVIIPTGTPDYGPQLGVSYDDPVGSLSVLARLDRQLQLTGEDQQRYLNIITKPVGISCEYCCGVGPIGADANGNSRCGCQHNPALLALTKWLIQNTDYSDAEVIREALRWKALFFPQKMVDLTMSLAGGDTSALDELPGMVGGC